MAQDAAIRRGKLAGFWHKTRFLTAWLLAAWFLMTFTMIFFARELATLTVFGWPLAFYMAAQGLPLLYLGIVAFYAWRMHHLESPLKEKFPHAASLK